MKFKCIDQWIKEGSWSALPEYAVLYPEEAKAPIIRFLLMDKPSPIEKGFDYHNSDYIKLAINILVEKRETDVRAEALFLAKWMITASEHEKTSEAKGLFPLLKNAESKVEDVLIKAICCYSLRKYYYSCFRDPEKVEISVNKAFNMLPKKSKHRGSLILPLASDLIQRLRYSEIENLVDELRDVINSKSYLFVKAMKHYTMFEYEEGLRAESELKVEYTTKENMFLLKSRREIADLVMNGFEIQEDMKTSSLDTHEVQDVIALKHSLYFLHNRRPEIARQWARKIGDTISLYTVFYSFALVRAELACRNVIGARLLMSEKKKINSYKSYFDDFYYARIELLAGNRELAATYFSKVAKACKIRKTMPYFNVELDLAIEISAQDLFFLTQSVNQYNNTDYKSLKANSTDKVLIEKKGVACYLGESEAINLIKQSVKKYAAFDVPVLIMGETGTGKDVTAHALHEESSRKNEPFLAINCGAIAETLLQSELFGHEAGAYTGANKSHKGIFEAAGKGTVFLDEIGEISQATQIALLRVLEAGEIRPVGSSKPKPYFCRVIIATNAPLEKLVDDGLFRQDLFYRLKRLEIRIPPLRERPKDIIVYISHFLREHRNDNDIPVLSKKMIDAFQKYQWPGNVRELKNEIEKMRIVHSEKLQYDIEDCPLLLKGAMKRKVLPHKMIEATVSNIVNKDDLLLQVRSNNKVQRRHDEIRQLFKTHLKLTRSEIIKVMGVSSTTATSDLRILVNEGLIEKVQPSPSPRTHYFILKSS